MANRPPSSRGAARGLVGGQPVAAQHMPGFNRPSTPSQYATGNQFGVLRPPTQGGLIGAPPGTALRPGSGLKRVPTQFGAQAAAGPVGLTTEVRVDARPATQQGLPGMNSKPLGPGRQVADRSYHLMEIRNKITDITSEMQKLSAEMEKQKSDAEVYGKLERKYESVVQVVRQLEGQLADYNLALDKLRTNTQISEIVDAYRRMKQHNDEERQRLDDVFMRRKTAEQTVQQLESELISIHQNAADALAALDPSLQQEYMELQQRAQALEGELNNKEDHLQHLEEQIHTRRSQLKSDSFRTHARGLELIRKKQELLRQRQELKEEASEALSPDQMREKLLQKVKESKELLQKDEGRVKQLEETVEKLQEGNKKKEAEVEQAKKHASKSAKYEALYERDRKMQAFLDTFDETRQQELANKAKMQKTIVALLEHISKGLGFSKSLPDASRLQELKQEYNFKEQKLEDSKATLEHVTQDLEKRKAELAKIDSLDGKISVELQHLRSRMLAMQQEMQSFKSPDDLRADAENAKEQLTTANTVARQKREALKQQVQLLSHTIEQEKKTLDDNDITKKLDVLQQKLRTYAQTAFTLSDYISSHEREGDYQALRADCMAVTDAINGFTISQL